MEKLRRLILCSSSAKEDCLHTENIARHTLEATGVSGNSGDLRKLGKTVFKIQKNAEKDDRVNSDDRTGSSQASAQNNMLSTNPSLQGPAARPYKRTRRGRLRRRRKMSMQEQLLEQMRLQSQSQTTQVPIEHTTKLQPFRLTSMRHDLEDMSNTLSYLLSRRASNGDEDFFEHSWRRV